MATFQYEAMNAAGQEVKAEIDAGSADEAITKIRSQGYFPTKVKEKAAKKQKAATAAAVGAPAKKGGSFNISIGGVSTKTITQFTRQLSTLQDAGLPILRSLKILWQQQKPGQLKNILDQVAADVESGSTLSESMARHPKAFDKLYTNMVAAGETGGVLDVILQRLAEFMEKAMRLKRRVIGAMIYPSVVITFSVLIVTGIMIFVVPKFREIFKDFRTSLPALTEWLMAISDWIAMQYGWLWILGSPFLFWFTLKLVGKTKAGRRIIDTVKLKLPIIGQILSKTSIARFTRTLGTLLSAGVPILDALNITRDTVGNVVFESALQKVHDAIREGESFAGPLRQAKVCDSIVTNMIDVGEETGDLDKMLMKIADNYDEEVDVLIGSLVSLLEPVMVVTLGGIVGTIVVALFLPLVKLIQSVSGGGDSGEGG
jgi:type IV pilus assembly protein PilC